MAVLVAVAAVEGGGALVAVLPPEPPHAVKSAEHATSIPTAESNLVMPSRTRVISTGNGSAGLGGTAGAVGKVAREVLR